MSEINILSHKIENIKGKILNVLKQYNVKKASLFGSIVRGEASDKSDIDLLIEFEGRKSLLDLAALKLELQELLKWKVDVLTYKSIHPSLKESILKEQMIIL